MQKVALLLACLPCISHADHPTTTTTTQSSCINIVNEKTKKCIAAQTDGSKLYMAACNSSLEQAWEVSRKTSEIISKASGKCIDRPRDNGAEGIQLGTFRCWHYTWGAQTWHLSGGLIQASDARTCVSTDYHGHVVLDKCSGELAKWRIQSGPCFAATTTTTTTQSSCVNIVNEKTNECVTMPDKGYELYMAPCGTSPEQGLAQAWEVNKDFTEFQSKKTVGKCMDRPRDRNALGDKIGTWTCWHYTWGAQTWEVSGNRIKAGDAKTCLSTDYHGHVVLDQCSGDLAKWRFQDAHCVVITTTTSTTTTQSPWINIVNQKTNECIVAPNDGSKLYMAACSTSPEQAWEVNEKTTEILSKATGKCMDRPHDNGAEGIQLGTFGCWHYTWGAQTWHLSGGLIKASDAETCLSTDYHGHVVLDKCSGELAKWRFEPSSSFSAEELNSSTSLGKLPVLAIIATVFAAITLAIMIQVPRVFRRFHNGRVLEPLLAERGARPEEQ